MMKKAEEKGVKLLLPIDTVVASDFPNPIDAPVEVETVDVTAIPADKEGLDIGEKTRALFADAVKSAKTVVWNGPMGVFENPTLAKGTIAVAQALADSDAVTIIGGGDSQPPASSWALPTRSPTSPPAAAHRSNSSRVSSCPASPACRTNKALKFAAGSFRAWPRRPDLTYSMYACARTPCPARKSLAGDEVCRGGRPCPPITALLRADRAIGPYKTEQINCNFDLDIGDFTP